MTAAERADFNAKDAENAERRGERTRMKRRQRYLAPAASSLLRRLPLLTLASLENGLREPYTFTKDNPP